MAACQCIIHDIIHSKVKLLYRFCCKTRKLFYWSERLAVWGRSKSRKDEKSAQVPWQEESAICSMIHSAALDKEYLPFLSFSDLCWEGRSWSTLVNRWGTPQVHPENGNMGYCENTCLVFISPGGDGTRPRRWIVGDIKAPFRRRPGLEAADSPRGQLIDMHAQAGDV